ncbi:MAG: penicillin-insensitive murein endopeptidase [Deltaproteobacteria bacterium]|nr:penicillin-insensitive murein endopeptidase [Deltaproteobacteria bacterium]
MTPPISRPFCLALALAAVGMVGCSVSIGGDRASTAPGTASTATTHKWWAAGDEGESAVPTRKWITHIVVPRETRETIAARYGVTVTELVRANKKKLGKKKWLYANQKLRIHARKFPPPREKIRYVVKRGDTWSKIAAKFHVSPRDLKGWNPKVPRAFKAGTKLKVYTDPVAPAVVGGGGGAGTAVGPLPEFHVRGGGVGVGKPNRGHLVNGVKLPKSDMVKILDGDKVWGTSHTIELLQTSIAAFRRDSGYAKPLTVSSISRRKGGKFSPHSSHQTGRDVDIRLPRKSGGAKSQSPSTIDWTMTWQLVKALADTGEVEYIFISWSRQKYLYRAAQSAGATKSQLTKLIQYPRKSKSNKGLVRHSSGHTVHLHVRFTCTPGNTRCKSY